jgi:hypothetical protein
MIAQKLIKILNQITSTRAAGMYLLLFAIAIGVATFVENDFGTIAAQDIIFRSTWFEILLFLFGATIVANIWRFKFIKMKKMGFPLFSRSHYHYFNWCRPYSIFWYGGHDAYS